jgi:hypothetical protein
MGAEYVGILDHEWTLEEVLTLPHKLVSVTFGPELSRLGSFDSNRQWTLTAWNTPAPSVKETMVWALEGPAPFTFAVGRQSLQIRFCLKVVPLLRDRMLRAIARRVLRQIAELFSSSKCFLAPDFNGDEIFIAIEAGARISEIETLLQKKGSKPVNWNALYREAQVTHPFLPPYFVDDLNDRAAP